MTQTILSESILEVLIILMVCILLSGKIRNRSAKEQLLLAITIKNLVISQYMGRLWLLKNVKIPRHLAQ